MTQEELNSKHLEAIRDTVTADTGNWGEYGGQNRESQIEAATACTAISIQFAIDVLSQVKLKYPLRDNEILVGGIELENKKQQYLSSLTPPVLNDGGQQEKEERRYNVKALAVGLEFEKPQLSYLQILN